MPYKPSLVIYYLFSALDTIGIQIFSGILYVYLLHYHFSMMQIGAYMSMFWLISTFTEISGGIFVDKYGAMTSLILSYCLRILGLLSLLFPLGFYGLILGSLFSGTAESFSSGTLSSWIITKAKTQNTLIASTQKITSKNAIISTLFSLIATFIGTEILYNIDKKLPLFIAVVVYSILLLLTIPIFTKEKNHLVNDNSNTYKGSSNTLKELKAMIKNFINYPFIWILLLASVIVDIGPSNQWQVLFYQNNRVQGYTIVLFNLIGIFTNTLLLKVSKKYQLFLENYIYQLLILDIIIILLISNQILNKDFFYLHVFVYGIIMSKIFVYLNDEFINESKKRTTILSIFYMAQSMFTSIFLLINGYLSEKIGFLNTWSIFSFCALVLLLIYMINRNKNIKRS